MRVRAIPGLLGGLAMLASGMAHSWLGWRRLNEDLRGVALPTGFLDGLAVAWHFAGAAMLAAGVVTIVRFGRSFAGQAVDRRPAQSVALAYVGFGAWAFHLAGVGAALVFAIPGLLVALSAWTVERPSAS